MPKFDEETAEEMFEVLTTRVVPLLDALLDPKPAQWIEWLANVDLNAVNVAVKDVVEKVKYPEPPDGDQREWCYCSEIPGRHLHD